MEAFLIILLLLVVLFVIGGVFVKWLFIIAVIAFILWAIMFFAGRSRV